VPYLAEMAEDEKMAYFLLLQQAGPLFAGGIKIVGEGVKGMRGVGGKGWRGDAMWRGQVGRVGKGGTIRGFNGRTPTLEEAAALILESGGKIERIELAHEPPNPHNFTHINYRTPNGNKGTIEIQGL